MFKNLLSRIDNQTNFNINNFSDSILVYEPIRTNNIKIN